ncbi:N-acyl-D-amino-acid deacylase family protein [Amycolatopsis thermoflava]|uniref:N-acyl-D-amino-acid deacylase family protein n=1 Tax=Amycolatopsis thermoflava TaxID=84480 RepID=UPI00365EB103
MDGTGAPAFTGDVAFSGDRILSVTRTAGTASPAREILDCEGLVVAPGFIDAHTHSDISFFLYPDADSKITQGVTTEVVGNCGFSAFPVRDERREMLEEFVRGLGFPRVPVRWRDYSEYAGELQRQQPATNVAALVGHGALRIAVSGSHDVVTDEDLLGAMARELREALEQGAFGLSTGLTYVPSRFITPPEKNRLLEVVRDHDGLYATHARADPGLAPFAEAIRLCSTTGTRLQYSHAALNDPADWGRAEEVVRLFEIAVEHGVDARYDVYPYAASASALTQYLPAWLQERGESAMRKSLADEVVRRAAALDLSRGLFGRIPWDWSRVLISLAGQDDRDLEGRTVREAAAARDCTPERLVVRLCGRYGNSAQVALFYRSEADVAEFIRHDLSTIGSDGSSLPLTAPGRPHPRNYGAHARVLERYVADGTLTLEKAVHKCTQAVADRLRLRDRGVLAEGAYADIIVFDPGRTRETATWTRPNSLAAGMRGVWVNGRPAVLHEQPTGVRAGVVLRRS